MKCRKHNVKKDVDLGGIMFCRKCLEESKFNKKNKGKNDATNIYGSRSLRFYVYGCVYDDMGDV